MKPGLALYVAAIVLFGFGHASANEPLDLSTRYGRYHAAVVIDDSGTASESHEWSRTVLKESALENAKRASISYSTSAQRAEVVAAYTLKADGRRIDVPKDNYQVEVNRGQGKDSPLYSDWTSMTVVFPDVAVGDTVVFAYRLTQTEPMFPGHYSTTHTFPAFVAYDDIRIKFDIPQSLWVQYEARGMKESVRSGDNGRKIIEWHHANPRPIKSERRNYSVFDPEKEVGYAISTFRTYADIAAAYGARALPKAEPTERIRQLAAEIVKGKSTARDQARALYEWVATHITYAGNCIGIGAVVPRDLPYVLDNKMGDCKDHSTLLQALLAARGIKSTQALVNAGAVYRLPKIPVVSNVNHVINYLPEFDLYLDSTSESTPFGMLPFGDQDKPVLLVDGYKDGTRTPVPPAGSDRQSIKSSIKIGADGSASGSVEVSQKGQSAAYSRAWARNMPKDAEGDLVKNMFRGQGMIGSGKFEKDDPKELTDSYRYKASYAVDKLIKLPGTGAFYIYPPVGLAPTISAMLRSALEPEKEVDITCSGGVVTEDYTIELPKQMKVLSIPSNLKVANEYLTYTASYALKGNRLTVKRAIDDRTKGNTCSPKMFASYKNVAAKAIDNLKEQVLYKF